MAVGALAVCGRREILRRILVAWIFGAAWQSMTTGATLTRFAKGIHLSEFGFGLLAAIPFLAAFMQLPASFIIERYGHRMRVFLIANLIHRSLWLVIAAIPWLLPREQQPLGLITLMLLSSTSQSASSPAWYSWLSDVVPSRIRGRYLSRRTQAGQIVSLILTVVVGAILDMAEASSGMALGRAVSVILALAAVAGIVDILFFVTIPDPGAHTKKQGLHWRELFAEPLQNRSFRRYLMFTGMITFSVGIMGQFTWLYVFDVVHLSNIQANMMLVTAPMIVAMFAVPFWGRMIDKLGRKPVAMIATACVIHGGVVWAVIREGSIMPGYLGILTAAFAWPGVDLASYNILLGLVRKKRGGGQNTAYVALNSVMVAAAGTASGLLGGLLGMWLKDWRGDFLGLPMTYHCILFGMSMVFRILALLSVRGIEDPRAFTARQAIQYMAADMYSNLQSVLMVPVRLAGRWSYKVKSEGGEGQGGKGGDSTR